MDDRILILGASGYIGSAFRGEFHRRGVGFHAVSRSECDYTSFRPLLELLREARPSFLVNCAGYTGKPNVDACETARAETLLGNVVLPQTIAHACEIAGVPWGHVSSGCIYAGAKLSVVAEGREVVRVERDLMKPEWQAIWQDDRSRISGFSEADPPNFSFRAPPCSFYSGSKGVGEEVLLGVPENYVWRLRIPFDGGHSPRNYLSKIAQYPKVYNNVNSLSHRGDCARACVDLWERRAPFGTYNVTNPGWVTARDVAEKLRVALHRREPFEFFECDADFYATAASAPRSNTVLDTAKLLSTGVQIRDVHEALDEAIEEFARAELASVSRGAG